MARTIMDALFDRADMKCTICGTKCSIGCDCWTKCNVPGCRWSYRTGTKCRNPEHHWNQPRKRKSTISKVQEPDNGR